MVHTPHGIAISVNVRAGPPTDLVRRKPMRRTAAERSALVSDPYRLGATEAGVALRHEIVAP